ncbi:copper amine oxidase N-terminal domain-containing protein [Paenibacillus sp. SC116]|uniref:copper amine oxidase N-terminal domain-containing protein n=1 Tax=Paenibacillus sp. SC116 TaxID=2968986 RepID=UPI00215AD30B|nr:copper amine oxidase N-terminal domain-containing protein [Paenibacillus sp. SC116]MCR8845692.1 copper amine oxidase N-terminal domain-containing protein [Paenibacillus sp. SC116]
MKCRRIAALVLAGMMFAGTLSTVPAHAEADNMRVTLNGEALADGGYIIDGKTYVSVRQLQDALQAFVHFDEKTKKLYVEKPNVHMLLFQGKNPFGKVETGRTSFSVLVQVDSLKTEVDSIRLTITDPKGNTSTIQEKEDKGLKGKDNFWFRSEEYKYDFKSKGVYTINCYMRQKNGDYTLLSQLKVEAVK